MRDGKAFKNCDSTKSMGKTYLFRKYICRQRQRQRHGLKKIQHVLYFRKTGALRISNMIQNISAESAKSAEASKSAKSQNVRNSWVLHTSLMSFLVYWSVGAVPVWLQWTRHPEVALSCLARSWIAWLRTLSISPIIRFFRLINFFIVIKSKESDWVFK